MSQPGGSGTTVDASKSRREFDMDMLVGYILLIGVLISLAFVVASLIWRWKETGSVEFDYQLSGMNFFRFTASEIRLATGGALRPRLLLSLGIIALMLTPYLRVLVSMVYFIFELKNWKYSLFTAFVLAMLTYSLFLR
jgi:uncharacterized membrane protein